MDNPESDILVQQTVCVKEEANELVNLEVAWESDSPPPDIAEFNVKQEIDSAKNELWGELEKSEPTDVSYRCFACDEYLEDFASFANHQLVHTTSDIVVCDDCDFAFQSMQDLTEHVENNHIKKIEFSRNNDKTSPTACRQCDSCFDNNELLLVHQKVCVNQKKWENLNSSSSNEHKKNVTLCKTESRNRSKINRKKPDCVKKLLRCTKCAYATFSKILFARHKNHRYIFKCTLCSITSYSSMKLYLHQVKMHQKTEKFSCDNCNFVTAMKKSIRNHVKIHNEPNRFKCSKCSYDYDSPYKLQRHMLEVHLDSYTVNFPTKGVCNECGFVAKKKDTLLRHMVTHSDLHPFGCTKCSYACNTTFQLRRHMQNIHSRKKKEIPKLFVCDLCGADFTQASNMKAHQKTHSQGNFYFCKKCDFSCRCHKSLKRHMNKHEGVEERKFSCAHAHCSYATSQMHHLKRHQVVHSRGDGRKRRRRKVEDSFE